MEHSDPMEAPYPGLPAFPARHFRWKEVACHHCGAFPEKDVLESWRFGMIVDVATSIRGELGRPLIVSSWYRCENHPLERYKHRPGVHTTGLAIDVLVNRAEVFKALDCAQWTIARELPEDDNHKVLGIGLRQKGAMATRFVHIDLGGLLDEYRALRPACWTY